VDTTEKCELNTPDKHATIQLWRVFRSILMMFLIKKLMLSAVVLHSFGLIAMEQPQLAGDFAGLSQEVSELRRSLASKNEQIKNLKKRIVLQQIFHCIGGCALDTGDVDDGLQYVLSEEVYGRFILSMRCLGGTADFTLANNNGFMIADAHNNRIWYNLDGIYRANPDAVFANFVGEVAMTNIRALGDGNLQIGYEEMREFTKESFPAIYDALGHMAEQQIAIMGNGAVFGSSVNQDGTVNADGTVDEHNILWEVPNQLSIFFNGEYIRGYGNIGVNPAGRDVNILRREIKELYNPHL
jgi:hypothetical protein